MKKNSSFIVLVSIVAVLLVSCSGGGAGSTTSADAIAFSEALTLYLIGGIITNTDTPDTGVVDMESDYSGTATQAETIALGSEYSNATGSIDYNHTYNSSESEYSHAVTFNAFSTDTSLYSSVLSGTTTTIATTLPGDSTSATTGTLTYDGSDLVCNFSTNADGDLSGSITFRGVAYPMN